MKKNKGFTLIELLAVIVVLGIIMLIAVTSVSALIEKSRKDAFVATAKSYIDAVRRKIMIDGISLPTVAYDYKVIYLDKSMVEKGGITSPYGRNYILKPDGYTQQDINNANSSMFTALSNVTVYCEKVINGNTCEYSYWVFLSDGQKTTGCFDDTYDNVGFSMVEEKELDSSTVATVASCEFAGGGGYAE